MSVLGLRPWERQPRNAVYESERLTISAITPNADVPAGGTSVTITGSGFHKLGDGSAPTVLFDETAATSVVVVNKTTITCTVPAGVAGVVDITVLIGTQSVTLAEAFTYYTADMLTFTPNHGPASGGTQITIFGRNFVTGSTFTFGGLAATGVTFLDDQHYLVTTPAHALGFVDVVMTEPGGNTVTFESAFKYTLLTRGEDIRRLPSISIHAALGNSPNTCNFVVDGTSDAPIPGERIQIYDGATLIFAGTVIGIKTRYEGQIDQFAYDVSCIDFTWLLNRRRPTGVFDQVSASEIVKTLISQFAPGFTTTHVQTKLAPITITFDGGDDFSTCLTRIAKAIGGGHWHVDYTQDIHFFHLVPPNFGLPSVSTGGDTTGQSKMPTGLSPAPVVTAFAAPSVFTTSAGWFQVAYTTLYSNGFESALSELPPPIFLSGNKDLTITGITAAGALGALTPVGTRVYTRFLSYRDGYEWFSLLALPIGVTSVTGAYAGEGLAYRENPSHTKQSMLRSVSQPAKPVGAPSDGTESSAIATFAEPFSDTSHTWSQFGGVFSYAIAAIYPDGTESLMSDASGVVTRGNIAGPGTTSMNGAPVAGRSYHLGGVPLGATVNGKAAVYRVIYQAKGGIWLPENISIAAYIPDNTTTDLYFVPMFIPLVSGKLKGGAMQPAAPVWPNDDGPFLEDTAPPDDIDDDNDDLLHSESGAQGFEIEQDNSQICNRLFLKGKGTTLTQDAAAGDKVLHVASLETPVLHIGGGQLWTPVGIVEYNDFDGTTDDAIISLNSGLPGDLTAGSPINIFLIAENKAAQEALGKIEFDSNGAATDGIHEATISDDSLETWADLYMKGFATLEQFALPIVTVRYATSDAKSTPGATVHIDLSHPRCKGDFLIQEVDIDRVGDESDEVGARYTVTASSVRFQLEDYLLQLGQSPAAGSTVPSFTGVSGVDVSLAANANADFTDFMVQAVSSGTGTIIANGPTFSLQRAGVTASTKVDIHGLWASGSAISGAQQFCQMSQTYLTFSRGFDLLWRVRTPTRAESNMSAFPSGGNPNNVTGNYRIGFGIDISTFAHPINTGSNRFIGFLLDMTKSQPNDPTSWCACWVDESANNGVIRSKNLLPIEQDAIYKCRLRVVSFSDVNTGIIEWTMTNETSGASVTVQDTVTQTASRVYGPAGSLMTTVTSVPETVLWFNRFQCLTTS